jgi:hypothetical protein
VLVSSITRSPSSSHSPINKKEHLHSRVQYAGKFKSNQIWLFILNTNRRQAESQFYGGKKIRYLIGSNLSILIGRGSVKAIDSS